MHACNKEEDLCPLRAAGPAEKTAPGQGRIHAPAEEQATGQAGCESPTLP